MDNGLSTGDILALAKDNGFGGGNGGMFFVFLLFLFAFSGGGFWGNRGGNTMNTINTDMQYTNLMNALGTMGNATSRGFDHLATQIGQGFTQSTNQNFAIQKDIDRVIYNNTVGQAGLSRELCDLSGTIRQGFCDTNRNIDANRYEMQRIGCDIITNANYNTRDITSTIKDGNQAILNKLGAMEMSALKDQLESERFAKARLENQLSNMAQSAHLINELAPTPKPTYNVCHPRDCGHHHFPIAQFS